MQDLQGYQKAIEQPPGRIRTNQFPAFEQRCIQNPKRSRNTLQIGCAGSMASSSPFRWLARCTAACISLKHLLLCSCQSGDASDLWSELGDRLNPIRNTGTEQQTEDMNVMQFGYAYGSAANFLLIRVYNNFTGSDVKLLWSLKQLLTHSSFTHF